MAKLFPKTNWLDDAGVTLYTADNRYPLQPDLFVDPKMPAEAVLSPDLSEPFRILTTARSRTFLEIDLGVARPIDAVAVIGLNSRTTATRLRVMLSNEATNPFVEQLSPTSLDANVGLNILNASSLDDDPRDPDGDFPAVSGALPQATSARVGFPTPSRALLAGANLQLFETLTFVDPDGAATSIDQDTELRESDSLVSALGTHAVTEELADGGRLLTFPWDAASLAALSGANAQLQVAGAANASGALIPSALVWFAALGGLVADSGWVNLWSSRATQVEGWRGGRNWFHDFGATQAARYVRIEIDDEANADGYIDISRVIIGDAFEPARTFAMGHSLGVEDGSNISEALSGQDWVEDGFRKRTQGVRFEFARRTEAHDFLDFFQLRKGLGGEVCLLWGSQTDFYQYEGLYGRLSSLAEMVHRTSDSTDHYWSIEARLRGKVSE